MRTDAELRSWLKVYVIADPAVARGRALPALVRVAIAGGATAVQYRPKTGPVRTWLAEAEELRAVTRAAGVPLVVNDRLDLALAAEADGVHLGAEDLPVAAARAQHYRHAQRAGAHHGEVAGVVAETVLLLVGAVMLLVDDDEAGARAAVAAGADYLGVGPVYATGTKPDAGRPGGPELVRRVVGAVSVPVVGIGGITAAGAGAVVAAGAAGVAVISAVMAASDVAAATRELAAAVHDAFLAVKEGQP